MLLDIREQRFFCHLVSHKKAPVPLRLRGQFRGSHCNCIWGAELYNSQAEVLVEEWVECCPAGLFLLNGHAELLEKLFTWTPCCCCLLVLSFSLVLSLADSLHSFQPWQCLFLKWSRGLVCKVPGLPVLFLSWLNPVPSPLFGVLFEHNSLVLCLV